MRFDENWTKEDDIKLKRFHECDWEDSCVMCQNFNECESEMKSELKNSPTLYERYEKMEEEAGKNEVGSDFREGVGDIFGKALKDSKGNMTLEELLKEIEEWYKTW